MNIFKEFKTVSVGHYVNPAVIEKNTFKQLKTNNMNRVLKFTPRYGMNGSHRKENNFQKAFLGLAIVDGQLKKCLDLKIYGTASKNYACIWINDGEQWADGSGSAGGGGYHRPSAAAMVAIFNAGINLEQPISGRGDTAIQDACEAIVKYFYPSAQSVEVISVGS